MSMIIVSLKRRNEALQHECDLLSHAFDDVSAKLQDAYARLSAYDPGHVRLALDPQPSAVRHASNQLGTGETPSELAGEFERDEGDGGKSQSIKNQ